MKKFLLFAAAMLALVACNKNNADEPDAPKKQIVLTATVNNNGSANGPHRVAPKDPTAETVHFTWEEGDQVYVMSMDQSEMEVFTLVSGSISPDGETAQFEGTELSNMSSYQVVYATSSDVMSLDYEIDYIEDSFKPVGMGTGSEENFTISTFGAVLKFQLKGDAKLGKIEYGWAQVDFYHYVTMNIEGGLQLTSTPKAVYFPIMQGEAHTVFNFYDTDGTLLDTKSKDHDFQEDMGSIITFPVLELNAVVPEAVDLGLSVKWASFNVGAAAPERYGKYFAWGETAPKTEYTWGTYFDTNDDGNTFTKYNCDGGKTVLDPEDDAAHVNWGGSWRMPTESEFGELVDNCTWSWTTLNGVNGYRVTSKTNSNSIFLPAAGFYYELNFFDFTEGVYWSSSLEEGPGSMSKNLFLPDYDHSVGSKDRSEGLPVRAVCD